MYLYQFPVHISFNQCVLDSVELTIQWTNALVHGFCWAVTYMSGGKWQLTCNIWKTKVLLNFYSLSHHLWNKNQRLSPKKKNEKKLIKFYNRFQLCFKSTSFSTKLNYISSYFIYVYKINFCFKTKSKKISTQYKTRLWKIEKQFPWKTFLMNKMPEAMKCLIRLQKGKQKENNKHYSVKKRIWLNTVC